MIVSLDNQSHVVFKAVFRWTKYRPDVLKSKIVE
jgi:hypothetical protein